MQSVYVSLRHGESLLRPVVRTIPFEYVCEHLHIWKQVPALAMQLPLSDKGAKFRVVSIELQEKGYPHASA
jgi:hypothetical protein